MPKKVVVIGASRGIGKEIARLHLKLGDSVTALARSKTELERLPKNPDERANLECISFDVRDSKKCQKVFSDWFSKNKDFDRVYYVSGYLNPPSKGFEYNPDDIDLMVQVNVQGAFQCLRFFEESIYKNRKGEIVGISSIAGDRGRKGNPIYNATKAALDIYLEGIRYRTFSFSGKVFTVKPGFIDTDMLVGMDVPKKGFLKPISAEDCAKIILEKISKGKEVFYVPSKWWLVATIIKTIPSRFFRYLNI